MTGKEASWVLVGGLMLAGCQAGPGPAGGGPAASPGASKAARPSPRAPVVLEEGTVLKVQLETTVSTATAKAGDVLTGKLLEALRQGERVLVPEGAEIRGRVVTAVRSPKAKGRARLVVDFDRLTVNGRNYDIATSALDKIGRAHV